MKLAAVLLLITLSFAGCTDLLEEPANTPPPEPVQDPTTPPPAADDPPTPEPMTWEDIPVVYHEKGTAMKIHADDGLSALRLVVNHTDSVIRIHDVSTVDHVLAIYEGRGPFAASPSCGESPMPQFMDARSGDKDERTSFGRTGLGENLVLVASSGAFEVSFFIGSGKVGNSTPAYSTTALEGSWSTTTGSFERHFSGENQTEVTIERTTLVTALASAHQTFDEGGKNRAIGNDSKGTLTVGLEGSDCFTEGKEQVTVTSSSDTGTAVSAGTDIIRADPGNVTLTLHYDDHDGSETSTLNWALITMDLPPALMADGSDGSS